MFYENNNTAKLLDMEDVIVAAFPPTILAFANILSPSCHFCFLLRLGHPSDHLFCPPASSA